jgi:preprotein translocase subunit SecD
LPGIVEADGHPSTVYYLLQRTPVITGSDLRSARPLPDENNKPAISFSLNQEGARKLGKATGENIGHRMAIVLDEQVRSAPTIDSRITSDGRITGSFTQQETQDLALILNSGALAAPVTVIGERFIEGRPGR